MHPALPAPPRKPPKRRAPPRYHHGDLPRAIREAALSAIAEVGPDGFTLREVARRLGVSHAAPYRHFKDKRALMTALAAEGAELLGERISRALDGAGEDLRARFLAAAHAYVRFAVDERARFLVTFFSADVDPEDPAMIAARQRSYGVLLSFIDEAQRAGFFREGDASSLATAIWGMHHGLAALASASGLDKLEHGGDLRAISDAAHGWLLDGLVRKKARGRKRRTPAG